MKYQVIPHQPVQSLIATVKLNNLKANKGFDIRNTLANDANYLYFAIQNGTRAKYNEDVISNWLKELLFQLLDDGYLLPNEDSLNTALDLD
jgi:hypothetical protein